MVPRVPGFKANSPQSGMLTPYQPLSARLLYEIKSHHPQRRVKALRRMDEGQRYSDGEGALGLEKSRAGDSP